MLEIVSFLSFRYHYQKFAVLSTKELAEDISQTICIYKMIIIKIYNSYKYYSDYLY
jgi:hypothetical protein